MFHLVEDTKRKAGLLRVKDAYLRLRGRQIHLSRDRAELLEMTC